MQKATKWMISAPLSRHAGPLRHLQDTVADLRFMGVLDLRTVGPALWGTYDGRRLIVAVQQG